MKYSKNFCYENLSRNCSFAVILAVITMTFCPQQSYASNNNAKLRALAKNFVNRISPVYEEEKTFNPLDQVKDGSSLLLRPRSNKVLFADDIFALKRNNAVYVSFEDMIDILEFAIAFDESGKYAEGWFLREDWNIEFDLENNRVLAKGVEYNIAEIDIYDDGATMYVRGDALAKWLDLDFSYDISQQFLDIESPYPLPAVSRLLRQKRIGANRTNYGEKQAALPRLDHEKSFFDINTADITVGHNYQRSSNGKGESNQIANVVTEGEILKHNAYVFASGDTRTQLNSVVSRLSNRSENADLLGPLKAKSYAIGDVNITDVPLTGSVTQDLGFRFDNKPHQNTDLSTTDIEGDGIPGWDVELYRNDILVDTLNVDQNGRYLFNDIRLFVGENNFELFFYGPQGEIRAEQVQVPVSSEILNAQNDTYEVSLSLEDTQTYQKFQGDDIDRESAHIAARYNKMIGEDVLGYVGVRSRELDGDRRSYLSAGASSVIGATFVDTNFAIDNDSNVSGEVNARRNIGGWDLALGAQANTEEFKISELLDTQTMELSASAQRRYNDFLGVSGNILANASYKEFASGSVLQTGNLGVSQNILGANISNRLRYEDNDIIGVNQAPSSSERLDHNLSVRKNFGKTFLRLGSTYELRPESQLKSLVAQANYRHNPKLSADVSLDRQVNTKINTLRLNANYTHDKVRTSPFLRVNSESDLFAGVNFNFNLTEQPDSTFPSVTGRRMTGRGMVSAFVYHDKNGNLVYDGEDEPLEGAVVRSLNVRKKAATDKNGYAMLRELEKLRSTDIVVQQADLPDPFLIPATQGRSVFVEEGTIFKMEFPIHTSGEIEGTVFYYDQDGAKLTLPFVDVTLLPLDNPKQEAITVRSESDGFYLSYLLPPGKYLVVSKGKKSSKGVFGNSLPKAVQIGYDGTIVQDVDLELIRNAQYVPYDVINNYETLPESYDPSVTRYLSIKKSGNSMLSKILGQLVQRRHTASIMDNLEMIPSDGFLEDGYELYKSYSQDPRVIHNDCAHLISKSIECSVVIIPAEETKLSGI